MAASQLGAAIFHNLHRRGDGVPTTQSKHKRSWPLLLFAACAFLPVLGFFFGAAAVAWGLLANRPRTRLAVGLGASGALLNIGAGMLLLWRLQDDPAYRRGMTSSTEQDLVKVVVALEQYHGTSGRYPADLRAFTQLPLSLKLVNVRDHSAGLFGLPRLYHYRLAPDGQTYDLWAVGAQEENHDMAPGFTF